MDYIMPVIYLGILGAAYAFIYHLNHKTPLPKGCENLKAECKGCHDTSCCNNPAHEQ